jgi:hypothetical protein
VPQKIGTVSDPAVQGEFYLVGLKGSAYVYSVITRKYFEQLQAHADRAPAEAYADNVYTPFTCPFSFTALTDALPYKLTPMGSFRFNVQESPKRDRRFLDFHLECLRILQRYELDPLKPWFMYAEDDAEYAIHFKDTFKKLTGKAV